MRRFGALIILLVVACCAAGCSKDVTIGAVISQSGGLEPYGAQVKRGLDLALDEINAAGGFQGGTIQLIYRDDESTSETGVREAQDLIENHGAQIIIGAVSSPVTLSIAPICQEKGVLLLSPSSSAPQITEAGDLIFRNYPSDVLEGTAMADFAKGQGVRRVVVFAVDNEFGDGLTDVFGSRFESKSREVVEKFMIPEGDATSLAEMVAKTKELKPGGIYIVAYETEIVSLLNELHASEIRPLIMATSSVTQKIPQLVGAAAEDLVYPQPSFDIESDEPSVEKFVEAYRARYDEDPDIYAAHGYDALKLIWQAMVDTGYSRPEEIKRGLLGLESYHGAAGRTSFDERGDVVRYPQLFVVRDGQPVPYEKFEQEGGELPVPGRG